MIFYCLTACIAPAVTRAQVSRTALDSLREALRRAPDDTTRARVLFSLGEEYWFNRQIPEALPFLQQCISLSDSIGYYADACNARILAAHIYIRIEQLDKGFSFLNDAMKCAAAHGQPDEIAKVYGALGMLHFLLGDHPKAISYSLEAIKGYEASERQEIRDLAIFELIQTGKVMEEQQQLGKALGYYRKALDKAEDREIRYLINVPTLHIAHLYRKQHDYENAIRMYHKTLELDKMEGITEMTIESLSGMGLIAVQKKQFPRAISFFRSARNYAISRNMLISADQYTFRLGNAYLEANQVDSAAHYFVEALQRASFQNDLVTRADAVKGLAQVAARTGDFRKAFELQQKAASLTDSIYGREKIRTVNNLEILHATAQKEMEIAGLREANLNQQRQVGRQHRLLLTAGIIAPAFCLILWLLYRFAHQKKIIAEKEKTIVEERIKFLEGQQQLLSLQAMINGQEMERSRMARDLHDSLGGLFSTLKMYLGSLRHEMEPLRTNETFTRSYALVDTAAEEIRRIAHNMIPEVLMKLGLIQAVRDLCAGISAGGSVQVKMQAYGMERPALSKNTEIMVYRIVQELLSNIIKHSRASEAIVQFNLEGSRLMITVEDYGIGFDPDMAALKRNAGLDTVRSRVNYLSGSMTVESTPDIGTTVMIDFTIGNQQKASVML